MSISESQASSPSGDVRRRTLSRKLRFEVLRRDNSTCRYCGASAPQATLHIDHILPVSKGGADDLLNLVAACSECNLGKSDRLLDDASMQQAKQRNLAELRSEVGAQKRIFDEFRELSGFVGNRLGKLRDLWWDLTGNEVHSSFDPVLRKWLRLFGFELIVKAMYEAAPRDIRRVGAYAAVMFADKQQPGTKRCYLIRGLLRKRFGYDVVAATDTLERLLSMLRQGIDLDDVNRLASGAASIGEFWSGCAWLLPDEDAV